MKVKLLVNHRVFFAKGSEIEVDEREGSSLLALGFAEGIEEPKKEPKAEEPKTEKEPVKKAEKPVVKKVNKGGRPKKK